MATVNWEVLEGLITAIANEWSENPDSEILWPDTQILEAIPLGDGTGFKVIYSGTPASKNEPDGLSADDEGPNFVSGISFDVNLSRIDGISNEAPEFTYPEKYYSVGLPTYLSGAIISASIIDFLGKFPGADSLPVEILSYTTPSQLGATELTITQVASGFERIIEYSDYYQSPTFESIDEAGNGVFSNLLGEADIDVIAFEVPAGVSIDEIILDNFLAPINENFDQSYGNYLLAYAGDSFDLAFDPENSGELLEASSEVIAFGSFGINENTDSLEGNIALGENFLTAGEKTSAPLSEGKYVLYLSDSGTSPIGSAYQISLMQGLSIPPLPNLSFIEGDLINFELPSASIDEMTLYWTDKALPNGLTLSGNNISGYLDDADFNGTLLLDLNADDGNKDKDFTFAVEITPENDPPKLVLPIIDQPALEDSIFTFTIPTGTFDDVDSGDSLTLSASLPDGSGLPEWLKFDESDGTFSGTPLDEHVGELEIKVTATDNSKDSVSDVFTVTVKNTNDNPIIEDIDPVKVNADSSATVQIIASDLEDDFLTYDLINPPDWASLDESGSVIIDLSQVKNFIELGEGEEQNIRINYRVSDGQPENSTTEGNFLVTVEGVNDAPSIELLDPLSGTEDLFSISNFASLLDNIFLSDPDLNDLGKLYYQIGEILSGELYVFDPSGTGMERAKEGDYIELDAQIQWKPDLNVNGLLTAAYELSATDGRLSSEPIIITYNIEAEDDAPKILDDNITVEVFESGVWTQQLSYEDYDDQTVTWQINEGKDASSFEIDDNGLLSFVADLNFENQSAYEISVSAIDEASGAEGLSDTIDINLIVLDRPNQELDLINTITYVPGDESLSVDFKYFQETFEGHFGGVAEDFGFSLSFDSTQLAPNMQSSLFTNGHFAYVNDLTSGVASINFSAINLSSDLPLDLGSIDFEIVESNLIQDFTINWTKNVDEEAGYDTQDLDGTLLISPDPDSFNKNAFLDLSAFNNDKIFLDLGHIDLTQLNEENSLVTPASLELIGRTILELNLPFEQLALTKNQDQLSLPITPISYHLGDGDDILVSPQWSLDQTGLSGASFGLLGRGSDTLVVSLEEQAPAGSSWFIRDFELGIDSISVLSESSEVKHEYRHDILNLIQSPSLALTGFDANFAPLIQSLQGQHRNLDSDRIFANGVSPLLTPELLIEPGTIEQGDYLELQLTNDSNPDVKLQIAGMPLASDEFARGDWILNIASDHSSATITYRKLDSQKIVDSESYKDFLELARQITVANIGDLDEASFDVRLSWNHDLIPAIETELIEPYATNITSRPTNILLSEVLSGSGSADGIGLQVKNLADGSFTNHIRPIALDIVAPLRQGKPSIIHGTESNDSITMLGDVVRQLETDSLEIGNRPSPGLSSAVAYGRGGDDYLIGKDGSRMVGGAGSDALFAELGSGTTQLVGGADNDLLIGGENDVLMGGQGDDDIVLRGLGARVFTGSGADTIMVDYASFGVLHGTGITRILDFSEEDRIVVNMPNLREEDLIVEGLATGSLVRVANTDIAQKLGSSDLMFVQGISDAQTVANRLFVTSEPGQFIDPLLSNLNPGTVGAPLVMNSDPLK